jgi:hypothetical protein
MAPLSRTQNSKLRHYTLDRLKRTRPEDRTSRRAQGCADENVTPARGCELPRHRHGNRRVVCPATLVASRLPLSRTVEAEVAEAKELAKATAAIWRSFEKKAPALRVQNPRRCFAPRVPLGGDNVRGASGDGPLVILKPKGGVSGDGVAVRSA